MLISHTTPTLTPTHTCFFPAVPNFWYGVIVNPFNRLKTCVLSLILCHHLPIIQLLSKLCHFFFHKIA